MKFLIEHSNYMLFNYGWQIFTVCFIIGAITTFIMYKNEKVDYNKIMGDDSNLTWDEYGNPTVKD